MFQFRRSYPIVATFSVAVMKYSDKRNLRRSFSGSQFKVQSLMSGSHRCRSLRQPVSHIASTAKKQGARQDGTHCNTSTPEAEAADFLSSRPAWFT